MRVQSAVDGRALCAVQSGAARACGCEELHARAVRYSKLRPYQLAEMLRTPLEELSLQISVLNLGRISDFLDKATQRPIFRLPRPSAPRAPARARASLSHTRV